MKSKILKNIHNSVKNLHKNQIVNNVTMRKFDALCLDATEPTNTKKSKRHDS